MSEDRVKELQEFADDFKQKLKEAKERYERTLSKTMDVENEQNTPKTKGYKLINNNYKKLKNKNRYVNNNFII